MPAFPCRSSARAITISSDNRLTADIDGTLDLDQRTDAGIGPNMGLLARQKLSENRVVHRAAFVQFDTAEEAQKAAFQNAVALRLEVRIHHADPLVVREVIERRFLGTLPVGEMR